MTDEPGNNPSLGSSEAASSSESRERGLGLASSLAAETYAVLEYIKDLGFEALIPPPTKGPSSPISSGQARSSGALDSKSGSPYGGPAYGAKSEAQGPGAKAGARAPSSFTPFPPSSSSGGRASGSFPSARPLDPQAPKEGPLWHQEARTLDELYQGLLGCRLCPLSAHRKKPFPGRGPQKGAKAMFLVEPPDLANAEAPKLPTGAYGALLNDIIEKGLKLNPEDCLITPLVKCPVEDPENPGAITLTSCASIARKEIELASPAIVLALGLLPGQALTGSNAVMTRLRLREGFIGPERIPYRITYGLTAMVAEPVLKKEVWRDLKLFFRLS